MWIIPWMGDELWHGCVGVGWCGRQDEERVLVLVLVRSGDGEVEVLREG